ncbi:MAG: LytTR family transcriptional regulator DNA-binding domain-containing protein, partial [Leptospiraceae bacterium]|nr:LytTR family transcriptional regulator DNA-binding domain-containing protein [Leptospiraceae bacterium]
MKVLISTKDNEIARKTKEAIIETLGPELKEVQIEKSFEKALNIIPKSKPNFFLFTYDMLFTNEGFKLPKLNVPFIVLGDSFRKAEDVIKAGALAFFTLPVDKEIIRLALHKWFKRSSQTTNLKFTVKGEEVTVPIAKLQYLEAENKICHLYLKDSSKKISVPYSMKKIFEELPSDFLKVHKTYVVRQAAIAKLFCARGSRYMLQLKNGKEIPVGRKYYQLLKNQYLHEFFVRYPLLHLFLKQRTYHQIFCIVLGVPYKV